jgi:hypothetical protein
VRLDVLPRARPLSHPEGAGGPATIENIRVACKPHNVLAARRIFGDAVMDRYTREASAPP